MAAQLIADPSSLQCLSSCSCFRSHARPALRHSSSLKLQHSVKHQQSSQSCRQTLQRKAVRTYARAGQQQQQQTQVAIPEGYVRYETMIVLRPDMTDENRDIELAKFEAFLNREKCKEIKALVRGRQQLAYPIKGFWEGIYVLYTYAAKRTTSQKAQKHLSTPVVGQEMNILRHMTFCV